MWGHLIFFSLLLFVDSVEALEISNSDGVVAIGYLRGGSKVGAS